MKKLFVSLCAVAGLMAASCTGNSEQEAKKKLLLGPWVMPVDSTVSGFELKENGVASSINSVFQFTSWNYANDTLFLTTVEGTTPWIVKTVSADSLVISLDNVNFSTWKHK